MGQYNFQRRFVPYIQDGSKQHTIRGVRRFPDKPGSICHLYTGLRKKGATLLGRCPCVLVQEIEIRATEIILIDGDQLSGSEADSLALHDGFPGGFAEMLTFWKGRLPFHGHIIHWSWKDRK